MTSKATPLSYTATLTAKYRDGSAAVLTLEDYGLLYELLEHLEELAAKQDWLRDEPEDT